MDRSHFHLRLLRWRIRPHQLPIQQHIRGHSSNVLVSWFLRREAQQVARSVPNRRASRRAKFFCAFGIFGLFFLPPNGTMLVAADSVTLGSKPLDIHVQTSGFGRASPADVTAVLQSAAFQIWRYCPNTQLDGIDVYYRADHPPPHFKRTSRCRNMICRPERFSWCGPARISRPCARTPTCATGTRSSRPNSCPLLKRNRAVGKQWRSLIAVPLMRRNRWRSILPSGAPSAPRSFVHSLPDSRQFSQSSCNINANFTNWKKPYILRLLLMTDPMRRKTRRPSKKGNFQRMA